MPDNIFVLTPPGNKNIYCPTASQAQAPTSPTALEVRVED